MAAEQVIYTEGGVRVTTTKVQIEGTTFPMTGITSVRRESQATLLHTAGFFLGLVGMVILGITMLMVMCLGSALMSLTLATGVLGLVLVGAGIAMVAVAPAQYALVLGTAGGDRPAWVSDDEEAVERARMAIEQAITLRG